MSQVVAAGTVNLRVRRLARLEAATIARSPAVYASPVARSGTPGAMAWTRSASAFKEACDLCGDVRGRVLRAATGTLALSS